MKKPLIFAIALLFSCFSLSNATVIFVQGNVSGTWSADTVVVTGEVRVPPGQSLTIMPGVEVLFSVYCKFILDTNATLRATGTLTDSIRFDVLPPNVNWHGIRFLSASDSSRLEYCILIHGYAGGGGEDCKGGALYCFNTSLTINSNTISENSVSSGFPNFAHGGGIYCHSCSPIISNNSISGNSAGRGGGGIYCNESNAVISGNTISGNSGADYGGGIYCEIGSATIIGNMISGNSADMGGGIFCHDGNACIIYNTISGNSATVGGGILCYDYGCNPIIRSTTIFRNSTSGMGGGVYNWGQASPTLVNCILWRNCPDQFYSYQGSPQVMYSDIMHGYVGTGNINVYPAFIDTTHNDFRLQWGSPCIDAGDPNPIYNDPDSTRADMGAWYYDQSMPVRILLTPYNQPIQIPATGGSFQYAIQATNIATATLIVPIWCDVTLPSGGVYGPVQGPLNSSLNSGQTISRIRTQAVPASAPPGVYHYNAYAVTAGDTSFDSFTFIKLGAGGWGPEAGNWTNTGEDFGSEAITQNEDNHPSSFILHPCYPNPFNSSVAISFQLLAASEVELKIYDISGREVAALGTGRWALGEHSVVWDANGMPSGIYFVRLTANSVQKVVLMK